MKTNWKCAYDGTLKKLNGGRCALCGRASLKESREDAKAWDRAAKSTYAHTPTPTSRDPMTAEDIRWALKRKQSDAAFIVRAVNAHEWYQRRLRLILDDIECGVVGAKDVDRVEYVESIRKLELEAIAKAEGK
jgi:hypothetical protein